MRPTKCEQLIGEGKLSVRLDGDQQVKEGINNSLIAGGEEDGGVGANDEGGALDAVGGAEGFATVEGGELGGRGGKYDRAVI